MIGGGWKVLAMSDSEADKRRDEVLKRMLNTPPKKHEPKGNEGGKPRGCPPKSRATARSGEP